MILLTGASGKTGIALTRALARRGLSVRAMVRSAAQVDGSRAAGAQEVAVGDLTHPGDLRAAMRDVQAVYLICPNMHPAEIEIARSALEAAREAGVGRFAYHSVMHPHTEDMPHHWKKLRVEELILQSGLDFTILQPCAYMQNTLAYLEKARTEGVFTVPYAVTTRISLVDLEDVAETAALVLAEHGHGNAIYELVGPEALSQVEVADELSAVLRREVSAQALDRQLWDEQMRAGGMPIYARETLLKMFEYYEKYHFIGNANVLNFLLGRPAHTFAQFVSCTVKGC